MAKYIKLFREFQNWEWYNDSITKSVFIELLLRARYTPKEYRGQHLQVGQCVVGRKEIADKLGLSEQNIRTALKHLKNTQEITIQVTNKYSLVTVVNWEKWQVFEGELTNNLTNNQPTTNQQLTTNKESKKEKESEDIDVRANGNSLYSRSDNDTNSRKNSKTQELSADDKIYAEEFNRRFNSEKEITFGA